MSRPWPLDPMPIRPCCGCRHPNEAREKTCRRCGAALPQMPGEFYVGVDMLPHRKGTPDDSLGQEPYRRPAWVARWHQYNRTHGNFNRP